MSDVQFSVCILAAGRGTRMGDASTWLPKPLLPVDGKAMVSHAIDRVPVDVPIVLALGFEADLVAGYIKHAYPDRQIHVVRVKNYDGQGSGPGASLLECRPVLPGPFVVWAVDSLFDASAELPLGTQDDWIGIAEVVLPPAVLADDVWDATPAIPYVDPLKLPQGFEPFRKLLESLANEET